MVVGSVLASLVALALLILWCLHCAGPCYQWLYSRWVRRRHSSAEERAAEGYARPWYDDSDAQEAADPGPLFIKWPEEDKAPLPPHAKPMRRHSARLHLDLDT